MPLAFDPEAIGMEAKCPYCRKQTELRLATPETGPGIPRKAVVWTLIAVAVLVLGLLGAFAALKQAESWAKKQRGSPPPAAERPKP